MTHQNPDTKKTCELLDRPLLERKRRTRVTSSMQTLKKILLKSNKSSKQKEKLKHADNLGKSVRYLRYLKRFLDKKSKTVEEFKTFTANVNEEKGIYAETVERITQNVTVIPKLPKNSGETVYVLSSSSLPPEPPKNDNFEQQSNLKAKHVHVYWRPWE